MTDNTNNLQLQYYGYKATHPLWLDDSVFGLKQLEIPSNSHTFRLDTIEDKMRLGFRVERFVFADLEAQKDIKILGRNIQIKGRQRTIGELDCLLMINDRPIHLEIIFKLYLYNPNLGNTEIEKWIGGNRWDSLAKKLNKLKTKQLPLLYHPKTESILKSYNLAPDDFDQQVLFKAQLYTPYKFDVNLKILNPNCLKGFYITPDKLSRFSKYQFYIPIKNDWLLEPMLDVKWLDFEQYKKELKKFAKFKSYTLSWLKYLDGSLEKFFVVWWVSSL